jgi:ribonuclease P protein subunit RPR2
MAKLKDTGKVPNKAIHSRVSYLYQAATYLQQQHSAVAADSQQDATEAESVVKEAIAALQPASRRLTSDLRAVSLKAQQRMSPAMKRSICKSCDTLLVDGSTCTSQIENTSKGGRKPWADTLIRQCNTCGTFRRYPMAAERQRRRPQRSVEAPETKIEDGMAED